MHPLSTRHVTRARASALVAAVASVAVVGSGSVFAQEPSPADGSPTPLTKIGYSVLGRGGGHWLRMIDEVTKAATAQGIEVVVSDPQFDAVKQVDQVTDIINGGAQAVIIAALDQEAIKSVVEFAHGKGVSVIADISGFEGADAYVGIDECTRGRLVGEYVGSWWAANRADDPPRIFESNADSLGGSLPDRTDCMVAAIQAAVPTATVVSDLEAWQEDTGFDAMSDTLSSHPEVNLVLGSNNEGTWGHLAAIESRGRVPGQDIFLATVDGQPRTLELIKEGKVLVADRIPQEVVGPLLVDAAVRLHAGEDLSGAPLNVDTAIITIDNVDAEIAQAAE